MEFLKEREIIMKKLMYMLLIVAGISSVSYYCRGGVDPVEPEVTTDGSGEPDTHTMDEPCPPSGD